MTRKELNNQLIKADPTRVVQMELDFYGPEWIFVGAELLDDPYPTVKLHTYDGEKRFLQPFRGYYMQISEFVDRGKSFGQSSEFGELLKDSTPDDEDMKSFKKKQLRLHVNEAINNCFTTRYMWCITMNKVAWSKLIDQFVDRVYEWLKDPNNY